MSYQVEWSRQAIRNMRRLDKPLVHRITEAVETFAQTGYGDVKLLTASGGVYRLRVGDWRVRFRIQDGEIQIMLIQAVLPRGEAYKRM